MNQGRGGTLEMGATEPLAGLVLPIAGMAPKSKTLPAISPAMSVVACCGVGNPWSSRNTSGSSCRAASFSRRFNPRNGSSKPCLRSTSRRSSVNFMTSARSNCCGLSRKRHISASYSARTFARSAAVALGNSSAISVSTSSKWRQNKLTQYSRPGVSSQVP